MKLLEKDVELARADGREGKSFQDGESKYFIKKTTQRKMDANNEAKYETSKILYWKLQIKKKEILANWEEYKNDNVLNYIFYAYISFFSVYFTLMSLILYQFDE